MPSLSEILRGSGGKLLDVLIEFSPAKALTKAEKSIENALTHPELGSIRLKAFADELSFQTALANLNTGKPNVGEDFKTANNIIQQQYVTNVDYSIAYSRMKNLISRYEQAFFNCFKYTELRPDSMDSDPYDLKCLTEIRDRPREKQEKRPQTSSPPNKEFYLGDKN